MGQSSYIPEVGQWRYIPGLSSPEQTASVGPYVQIQKKRHLPDQRLCRYQRCIDLLKKEKHIWYTNCNCRYHLVKLTVIHSHSPRLICLLHRPNKIVKWGCGGNQDTCLFQVLRGGTNFCNHSMKYCFWFTIFLGRDSSNGFYLVFSIMIFLTS